MPHLRLTDGETPFPLAKSPLFDPSGVVGRIHVWNDEDLDVLQAFESVSRRMEDLARDLGCLGFFDDGEDDPKAA